MSFSSIHKIVAYLIAVLGLLALSFGEDLAWQAQLAIALGVAASWFSEGALVHDKRWVHGWTIAVIAFLAIQVVRGLAGQPVLMLAIEFAAGLQVSRLFNRRGAREHQQIAALAMLHLIAATVLSTELSYALVFLAFVVIAPWMLALSHLRLEIEGQFGARPEGERERTLSRVLASKRLVSFRYLGATAALGVPLFAMTGVLFIAFPRVGLGFLSLGPDRGETVSGFGANMELGDFGTIRLDPTVIMRVTPPDLPEPRPPLIALRMRGTSFDHYDGRSWTRSRDLHSERVGRLGSLYAVPVRIPHPSEDRPWEIVLDGLDEPVIFLPPGTMGLEITPRITGGNEVGRQIEYTPDVEVRYSDADGLGLRYRAWVSSSPYGVPPGDLSRYLQIPEGHEHVARLARLWTEGATDDVQRAQMLLAHLRDTGEYQYTLDMPHVGRRSLPLEVFLFEARRGHCEYFASALAILLRTVGIPSRNVAGFLGGRYNDYGGYYALTQGDAHSWVEAWLPDRGWVTLDPTPFAREEIRPDDNLLADLRDVIDAIRTRWAEDVVGYDLRTQVGLFRRVRRWIAPRAEAHAEGRAEPGASHRFLDWRWILVVMAIGAAAVALMLRRRRRRPGGVPIDPAVREVVGLYQALDRALKRLGHARPDDRTPLEHVAHLEAVSFGALTVVREITARYVAARYGGVRLDPGELARLGREVAALRRRRDLFASTV